MSIEKVRAKFNVRSIERVLSSRYSGKNAKGYDEYESIKLSSPSGNIELGVVVEDIAKFFELGKEYYIDFSKAE